MRDSTSRRYRDDRLLRPWQRTPDWYICAECSAPSERVIAFRGACINSCEAHYEALTDLLMDNLNLGALVGNDTRSSWRIWLASRRYLLSRLLTRAGRARRRESIQTHRASDAALKEIKWPGLLEENSRT